MVSQDDYEPSSEQLQQFRENLEEIEIFLGRNFDSQPGLDMVPEEVEVPFAGKYASKGHNIVLNPAGVDYDDYFIDEDRLEQSELDKGRVAEGLESLKSKTEEDVRYEELSHAMMAEELGVSEPQFGREDLSPEDFLTDPLKEEAPVYIVEGFADFCRSYLSDTMSWRDTENILGFLMENNKLSEGPVSIEVRDSAETYVGHLFFRSYNGENSLEDTLSVAFENPREHGDLREVVETVENGGLDYDEDTWKFAKELLEETPEEDRGLERLIETVKSTMK